MMPTLNAFREIQGHYELVGELELLPDRTLFSYADEYLARPDAAPISRSLRKMDAEKRETHFFEGLLPEEGMRDAYNQALHDSMQVADGLLTRLNNESAWALIFG